MSNHSTGTVIVPEPAESWTCEIETDLNQFSENLAANVAALRLISGTGYESAESGVAAESMFTGDDGRWLVFVSARSYRRGWLSVVISRYAQGKEDGGDYEKWAEVGQSITDWLQNWIFESYNVKPIRKRMAFPSWDEYNV